MSPQRPPGPPGHFVSSVSTPSLPGEGPIPPLQAAPHTHQRGTVSFPAPLRPPTPIRNNAPGWRRSPPPAPGRQEGQLGWCQDDTTGPARSRRGARRAPRRPAPAPPAPPGRAEGPRVPSLSRCGLRRRSVPPSSRQQPPRFPSIIS